MYLIIKSIYPNLEREMLKNDKTVNDLIKPLESDLNSIGKKMIGRYDITVAQAQKIKKAIGSDLPLEELFKREGD